MIEETEIFERFHAAFDAQPSPGAAEPGLPTTANSRVQRVVCDALRLITVEKRC